MSTFKLSEEQLELQKTLARFFRENCGSEYLRSRIAAGGENDPVFWSKVSELGLFEFFSESTDDGRIGFRELVLVALEAGRALSPAPLAEALLLGPVLALKLLPDRVKKTVVKNLKLSDLETLASGGQRIQVAPRSCTNLGFDETNSAVSGSVGYFTGDPDSAYVLLESGNGEFYLVAKGEGFSAVPAGVGIDLTRAMTTIELKGAKCASIGVETSEILSRLLYVIRAAEVAGICRKAIAMTVDHVSSREQFGVPVGGFQAVQHGLAEMYLYCEALDALVDFAAWAAESSKEQFPLAALSALGYAGEKGVFICERAIQLHGGIGFTWEYDLHLCLRRVLSIEACYRDVYTNYDHVLELAAAS